MSALLITAYAIEYIVYALFRGRTVSMHMFSLKAVSVLPTK